MKFHLLVTYVTIESVQNHTLDNHFNISILKANTFFVHKWTKNNFLTILTHGGRKK